MRKLDVNEVEHVDHVSSDVRYLLGNLLCAFRSDKCLQTCTWMDLFPCCGQIVEKRVYEGF